MARCALGATAGAQSYRDVPGPAAPTANARDNIYAVAETGSAGLGGLYLSTESRLEESSGDRNDLGPADAASRERVVGTTNSKEG